MNENIPATQTRIHQNQMVRSIISIAGLCLVFVSLFNVSSGKSRPATPPPVARPAAPTRILMIGDSLTVGAFGGAMHDFLVAHYGVNNVAVYGSCGSSPEHWLRDEPKFVTKCGFRQQTSQGDYLYDFKNGRPPQRVVTPKLEKLLAMHRPNVVIVQLGTNWMDRIAEPKNDKQPEYNSILDRFIAALRGGSGTVRRILWITPPDSSHFTKNTQRKVEILLRSAARRDHFDPIISSEMTHYLVGKTGGDGVHYNEQAGTEWANRVARRLGKL